MINFDDHAVLITGGTGTFGQAMAHHLLFNQRPHRLVIFSRNEHRQADMAQKLQGLNEERGNPLRFFIGDVRDRDRLQLAMRGVDFVIHAAALKSIMACEYNPQEAIATNIIGTQNVVEAAIAASVTQVIGISSDKAAAPTTLYGTSKLAMERILASGNALSGMNGTRFSSVRYGNVLGSAGSVLPLFRKMIAQQHSLARGIELPITHIDATRFFWTVEDAIRFTLEAMRISDVGEVRIPKLRSMRIAALARTLAPGCALKYVGLRPGEKIFETMVTSDEELTLMDCGDSFALPPMDAGLESDERNWGLDYHSSNSRFLMDETEIAALVERADREAAGSESA